VPRKNAVIFADEDVDGLMSATIVAKRYMQSFQIKFVTARSLPEALRRFMRTIRQKKEKEPDYVDSLDVYVVDVGINRASIGEFSDSAKEMTKLGIQVLYFDSHSNKFNGQTLLPQLEKAGVMIHLGPIGTAAATIIHEYIGTKETNRLRKLGALSDREVSFNEMKDMLNEKDGLRMLQASVAWGAWKERSFLHRISRELVHNPNLNFTQHEEILEFSELANKHRDRLYRHVVKYSQVLELSSNPRILAVFCLDRNDFGKARGTIAGHLAGEWSGVILLITYDETLQYYSISIRNHYRMKVDLERLGQLAMAESAGGSKGAYRITLKLDMLIPFLVAIQNWSYSIRPPWVRKERSSRQKRRDDVDY
jgi:hypothetical protein